MSRDRFPTPPRPDSRGSLGAGNPVTYNNMNNDSHAQRRRELLDNLRTLSSLGLNQELQLPQLVCIGSQSAGKSSLIETLCRITLPRSAGTCTRCPIECRSRYTDQPWSARVSLRFEPGSNELADGQEIPFGDELTNPEDLEMRISQAQLAVLSPGTNYNSFLVNSVRPRTASGFTASSVIVDISGESQADLNFVDLPGVITNASDNSDVGHIELVKDLIRSYIYNHTTIILLVVSCQSDYETQGAGMLAREADPEGRRVLTKPDRVDVNDPDDTIQWIEMVEGMRNVVANGWYCVKQPDTQQRAARLSWEEARDLEHEFFRSNRAWSNVSEPNQHRLGAEGLIHQLGIVLSAAIDARSSEIAIDIERLMQEIAVEVEGIPTIPNKHPANQILDLLMAFFDEVREKIIEGDADDEFQGVVQSLRQQSLSFRRKLHLETAPIFMPNPNTRPLEELAPPPEPLSGDDEIFIEVPPELSRWRFKYTYERVEEMSKGAIRREPSDFGSNNPVMAIMRDIVVTWERDSLVLLEDSYRRLKTELLRIVHKHFSPYAHGGLDRHIRKLALDLLDQCKDTTKSQIRFLSLQETPSRTFQDVLYTKRLHRYAQYYKTRGATEPGLTTMARVRTLYEIAFQRYTDAVPLTIDVHCVRGFGDQLRGQVIEGLQLQRERIELEGLVKIADPVQDHKRALEERSRQLAEVRGNLEHLRQ